jgi:hypothetical protein
MVAFRRYERKGKSDTLVEQARPPLRVTLPGGEIYAEDPARPEMADYALTHAPQRELRLYGIYPGETVLVIGQVRRGARSLYVDAETVYFGSRADYLASEQTNATRIMPVIVLVLAAAALGCYGYAVRMGMFGIFSRAWWEQLGGGPGR